MRSSHLLRRVSGRGLTAPAVSFVGGSWAGTSFGTSVTAAVPTGVQSGDILFAMRTHAVSGTGWAAVTGAPGSLLWKVCGSSEPSVSSTAGASTQIMVVLFAFRNVHQTSPIDAQSTAKTTTNATTLTSNAVTSVHDRSMLMSCCRSYLSSGTPTLTIPAGMNLGQARGVSNAGFGMSYLPVAAAATSSGTPTWTVNTSSYDSAVQNFFLRPYDT